MACMEVMDDYDLSRFRTKTCQRFKRGLCEFRQRCQYSHNIAAQRRCPFLLYDKKPLRILRYLPLICEEIRLWQSDQNSFDPNNGCSKGAGCPFAHSVEEIIYHPFIYKQKYCPEFNKNTWVSPKAQDIMATCSEYYCPFIHHNSEKKTIDLDHYFLASSVTKQLPLKVPYPIKMLKSTKACNSKGLGSSHTSPVDNSHLDSLVIHSEGNSKLHKDDQYTSGSMKLSNILSRDFANYSLPQGSRLIVASIFNQASRSAYIYQTSNINLFDEQNNVDNNLLLITSSILNAHPGDIIEVVFDSLSYSISRADELQPNEEDSILGPTRQRIVYGKCVHGMSEGQFGWIPISIMLGWDEKILSQKVVLDLSSEDLFPFLEHARVAFRNYDFKFDQILKEDHDVNLNPDLNGILYNIAASDEPALLMNFRSHNPILQSLPRNNDMCEKAGIQKFCDQIVKDRISASLSELKNLSTFCDMSKKCAWKRSFGHNEKSYIDQKLLQKEYCIDYPYDMKDFTDDQNHYTNLHSSATKKSSESDSIFTCTNDSLLPNLLDCYSQDPLGEDESYEKIHQFSFACIEDSYKDENNAQFIPGLDTQYYRYNDIQHTLSEKCPDVTQKKHTIPNGQTCKKCNKAIVFPSSKNVKQENTLDHLIKQKNLMIERWSPYYDIHEMGVQSLADTIDEKNHNTSKYMIFDERKQYSDHAAITMFESDNDLRGKVCTFKGSRLDQIGPLNQFSKNDAIHLKVNQIASQQGLNTFPLDSLCQMRNSIRSNDSTDCSVH